MSQNPNEEQDKQKNDTRTFSEEVEVAGNQALDRIRDLVKEGNVRRLILRNQEGKVLVDTPLTVGLGVGGVAALMGGLPLLLITAGVAALARVRIEVVREVRDGDVLNDRDSKQRVEINDEDENRTV